MRIILMMFISFQIYASCNTGAVVDRTYRCFDGKYYVKIGKECKVRALKSTVTISCENQKDKIITSKTCDLSVFKSSALLTCSNRYEKYIFHKNRGKMRYFTSRDHYDPCGDNPNEEDEIVLKSISGQYFMHNHKDKSPDIVMLKGC